MNLPNRPSPSRVDRLAWWLWGVTFVVLVVLAVQAGLLEGQVHIPDTRHGGGALAGLVLFFCVLVGVKQGQLNRMRAALRREEMELEDVRTRLSEITELFRVSTTLNVQLPLDAVLEIIVRRVVSALRAQQASIMLHDADSGLLETRASYGLDSEHVRNAKRRLGEGIAGWVAEKRKALLLGPQEPDQELRRHFKANRDITSALSLPIRNGERCIGVLNVNRISHPEPFREHHCELLRLFAEQVGSVVERAEALERLSLRTRTLEAANLELSELNRLKDTFLSTASHELRTPLTSVIAYAEMLEEERLTLEQRREFLRRLSGEAGQLLGLIDDILDLSRLENGKMVLQRASRALGAIAQAAIETVRPMAQKHRVHLRFELEPDLPDLSVDEVKVRQVVVNLLVNAIKFSPGGETVLVAVRGEEGWVALEVRDHGPGVERGEASTIFDLFGQGRRRGAAGSTGVGIGLHLVRRITELHGGHVGVESEPGGGSTFWVRLPTRSAEASPSPEIASAA